MVWKRLLIPKSLQLLCKSPTCKSYNILWATEHCLCVNYSWHFCLFLYMKLPHAFPRLSQISHMTRFSNFVSLRLIPMMSDGFFLPYSFGGEGFALRLGTQSSCTVLCSPGQGVLTAQITYHKTTQINMQMESLKV